MENSEYLNLFNDDLEEHIEVMTLIKKKTEDIFNVVELLSKCIENRGKIIICGNGGSAADAQNLSSELVGRFEKDRKPLPAISLSTDTSIITSVSNDYCFEKIFSRQIEAIASRNDCLFLISTSNNSDNLIDAAVKANNMDIDIVSLLGRDGGKLKNKSTFSIVVPSSSTARIQEAQKFIYHFICLSLEKKLKLT